MAGACNVDKMPVSDYSPKTDSPPVIIVPASSDLLPSSSQEPTQPSTTSVSTSSVAWSSSTVSNVTTADSHKSLEVLNLLNNDLHALGPSNKAESDSMVSTACSARSDVSGEIATESAVVASAYSKYTSDVSSGIGIRRVFSNLDRTLSRADPSNTTDLRRTKSLTCLGVSQVKHPFSSQGIGDKNADGQVQKVRFFLGCKENKSFEDNNNRDGASDNEPDDECVRHLSRSRLSSFKDLFRNSSKRKKKKTKEAADGEHKDHSSSSSMKTSQPIVKDSVPDNKENLNDLIARPGERSDEDLNLNDSGSDSDERSFWSKFGSRSQHLLLRRSHSTKSRVKALRGEDDDEDETKGVAYSAMDGSFLNRGSSFILRHFHFRHFSEKSGNHNNDGSVSPRDSDNDSNDLSPRSRRNHSMRSRYDSFRKHQEGYQKHEDLRSSIRRRHLKVKSHVVGIVDLLRGQHRLSHRFHSPERSPSGGLIGHSLASVELGSWAARGSRRGSALPPFCASASLSPTEASSRTEILQTISSSIIHLFQRKPLKENELGALQEHVRFLITSEAGGLVQEYYKDQLLRKGMIILREKIKNEQGLDLLRQLGETWDYFFKEILPSLQAILYPLSSLLGLPSLPIFVETTVSRITYPEGLFLEQQKGSMNFIFQEDGVPLPSCSLEIPKWTFSSRLELGISFRTVICLWNGNKDLPDTCITSRQTSRQAKEETVRSLSLLAFRNIVVLKVSIREALDSVEKHSYPARIQQMLLVLQSIQDNVFLSENQFLLEKLVARVVCPYLGQRGVYEGSPNPVIKVKLKPIPFNIPSVVVGDNGIPTKTCTKLDCPASPSHLSLRKGFQDGGSMNKLKPVLEHVYDGGRRHSIMS